MFDQQPVELIEGELISKMGKKRPHVRHCGVARSVAYSKFSVSRFVNPEAPIDVAPQDNPTNEPQPDAIVLRQSLLRLPDRHSAALRPGVGRRGFRHITSFSTSPPRRRCTRALEFRNIGSGHSGTPVSSPSRASGWTV